ncbi:MAG: hypothetical protein ACTSYG_06595 [Candidatus Heimdallarchaeota archaeon]
MKFFKITLRQNPVTRELIYPTNYQAEIGNFNEGHLYVKNRPELIMCIKDENAKGIVREYVEEITEAEAKAISEANETRMEEITNEAKVRRIEIKTRIGRALTPDEERAIDPDDPTPGFGKKKILADKIDELKKEEKIKKV